MNTIYPALVAAAPLMQRAADISSADAGFSAISLMIVGMLVVFTALVVIGESLYWLGRLLNRGMNAEPPTAEVGAATAAAAPSDVESELDPNTLAVITAAAFVAIGRPVRVARVSPSVGSSAWAGAGRLSIQTSHNVRRSL